MNFVVMMKKQGEREYNFVVAYDTFEECKEFILEYVNDELESYNEFSGISFIINEVK